MTSFKNGEHEATYTYNPGNLRRTKTVDGKTTQYVWDGSEIAAEIDKDYDVIRNKYIYGLDRVLCEGPYSANTYYQQNSHGDTIATSNYSGATIVTYEYDAFGNQLNPELEDSNPFRYCGQYLDNETGSYYLRARYYAPAIGRFTTEDPARNGLNWYTYCSNDSVNRIDPWGLADVIARDYLEERGAEVTYTGDGTASVKYNGKTYTISGTINSDERLIMDDADLDSIFGWTTTIYYFYGSDQEKHATANIKDLRNNGKFAVIGKLITSTSDFTNAYNAMPETVDSVIVNLHGSPSSVSYMDISQLDMTKSIETFVLLSCNAGHQWTGDESFASKIANASGGKIGQLIAADGTHYRGRFLNPFRGIKVEGDATWKGYIASTLSESAKSKGFIRYKWNGTSYEKDSIGNSFSSVRSLLKKVGVK